MSKFDLVGLDGANPLGFLAAIGTLRTATAHWEECSPRMGWIQSFGGWRPYLEIGDDINEEAFIEGLNLELKKMKDHRAFSFAEDLSLPVEEYRSLLIKAAESSEERIFQDFLAAFGSEAISDDEKITDTALRTMAGAGHQHFIGSMKQLARETEKIHIRNTLFMSWSYQDDKPSMRWDPNDDRRYALRWKEPSGDKIRTVRGGNRLAIEGLPMLPTMPVGKRLETTGFTQKYRRVVWTWPIWSPVVSVDVLRSLLALDELQAERPDRRALATRGVVEIFRCQRITEGKYRNFTPAAPA